jgi:hypothetical protein
MYVRESTQVLMLSKKQRFEPCRMGLLWFGGVLVFVCVELAAALLSVQGSALRTEYTASHCWWPVYCMLIL